MSPQRASRAGRTALLLSTVMLLIVACTLATALACAIGYALSGNAPPIVHISSEADRYARQSLFTDATQMGAFTARLQELASTTRTSVAVTYIDRPRPGETVTAATQRAVEGLEAELAARTDAYERSMLVVVLMGKPRIFGFAGNDRAGTRLFLRNLSGNPAVHSLNFKHIQVSHGRYLMQALSIAQDALRPLNVLVDHHPAQWLIVTGLEKAANSVPELPGEVLLAIVKAVRAPLAALSADYAVPPILLLIVPLALLSLLIDRIEKLADTLLPWAWARNTIWAVCRYASIPVAGTAAVVVYGSLENIASLSQMSGQPLLDLLHLARSLPAITVPAWASWLAIPAAAVIALGVTLGIGLRLTGGDAHKLITPSRWFSGVWLPVRLPLCAVFLGLALLLPVPFMLALASMEGLMALALPASLLLAWTGDIYRFWRALGADPAPSLSIGQAGIARPAE